MLFETAAVVLLVLLAGVAWRVRRGPGPADRIQGLLGLGTTLVAVLLLLAYAGGEPALLDVALIFALLAAVISIAFATYPHRDQEGADR